MAEKDKYNTNGTTYVCMNFNVIKEYRKPFSITYGV